MAKIIHFIATVAFLQCFGFFKGEANSKSTKHRHQREVTVEEMQWDALNYTFYANPDVFLLNSIANSQNQFITNHTHWDKLFAEQIIGTPDVRRTLFKAWSGPFWVQKELFPTVPEPFKELTIQAHLLKQEIPPFASSISVLFSSRDENLFSANSRTTDENSGSIQPCFRATARYSDEESSGSCTPQEDSEHCIANIPIPISWHERSRSSSVHDIVVSYTLFPPTSVRSCEPHAGNSISSDERMAEAAGLPSLGEVVEIGRVSILSWEGQMDLVEEDQFVGLHVPSRRLGIGEQFAIPITINQKYMVNQGVCTIKAKAREGIAAVSVSSTSDQRWHTLSMVKQKSFAMVTAEGTGSDEITGIIDSEDSPLVFVMHFEVLNDTSIHRLINWRVDCSLRGADRASRFSTDIMVSDNWIQAIVPMAKGRTIINTAILTGREVTMTLDIGVVTFLGDVMDAAGHARCRSADTQILKVRRSCTNIYLDGTETSGSESVGIHVSLQGHEASLTFSVWVPEIPVRLELSDVKLSSIRGWKVASGRHDEGILEPEKMLNGDGDNNKKNTCHLRYQQSKITVYTRFYAPNANSMSRPDGKRIYLFGEDMEQSITHLVKNQITVTDHSIAKIEGTKIIAKSPGNTNIQVLNPRTREVIGESPLMVAADKVNIAYMRVTLVSGMSLAVHDVNVQGSNVKIASISALSDLFVEHQYIKFPQGREAERTKELFYEIAGFPSVLGAIDCTHVGLNSATLGRREALFVNRKFTHSINVQMICDTNFIITNVVARWPGCVHDSRILKHSRIGRFLHDRRVDGLLLGDSGYPLRRWIMTPFANGRDDTPAKRAYNRAHTRTRVLIEQTFGQLKNKFRCLKGHGMQMAPRRVCDVIVACAVLFNISKNLNEPEAPAEQEMDEVEPYEDDEDHEFMIGQMVQMGIVRDFFS